MRSRSLVALLFLAVGCLGLLAALELQQAPADPSPRPTAKPAAKTPPVLPGLLHDGTVQLPNQWKLTPAGRQIEVGDLPVNMVLHPSGQYLAVLHAGFREHEIIILDLNRTRQKIVSRVTLDQTYIGLAFAPDGKKLYASGGEFARIHEFDFLRGYWEARKPLNSTVRSRNWSSAAWRSVRMAKTSSPQAPGAMSCFGSPSTIPITRSSSSWPVLPALPKKTGPKATRPARPMAERKREKKPRTNYLFPFIPTPAWPITRANTCSSRSGQANRWPSSIWKKMKWSVTCQRRRIPPKWR